MADVNKNSYSFSYSYKHVSLQPGTIRKKTVTSSRKRRKKTKKRRNKVKSVPHKSNIVMAEQCNSSNGFKGLSQDVSNWHWNSELSYWKARAISLEYENMMLHSHLKHIYLTEVQEYESENQGDVEDYEDATNYEDEEYEDEAIPTVKPHDQNGVIPKKKTTPKKKVAAIFPDVQAKSEILKEYYGKNCHKIMGLETAVQLNYEKKFEDPTPRHWPHLPLNI